MSIKKAVDLRQPLKQAVCFLLKSNIGIRRARLIEICLRSRCGNRHSLKARCRDFDARSARLSAYSEIVFHNTAGGIIQTRMTAERGCDNKLRAEAEIDRP